MRGFIALLIVLALLLIAVPASANSSYTYTVKHHVEVQLDGEFDFNSTIVTPAQGNVDVSLAGEGVASLLSILEIIEQDQVSSNWFDLF
jgi:uncharacterized membrane protein